MNGIAGMLDGTSSIISGTGPKPPGQAGTRASQAWTPDGQAARRAREQSIWKRRRSGRSGRESAERRTPGDYGPNQKIKSRMAAVGRADPGNNDEGGRQHRGFDERSDKRLGDRPNRLAEEMVVLCRTVRVLRRFQMDGERNVVLVRKSAQRRRRAGRNDLRQCDGKQSQPADVPLRGASVEQVADSLAGAQPTDRSKPNNDPIADSCQACAGIQLHGDHAALFREEPPAGRPPASRAAPSRTRRRIALRLPSGPRGT